MKKLFLLVAIACWALAAPIDPKLDAALSVINAGDLKADLSFLSSDALQGRYTPSPGLDIAAEFIAAQFRGAGLEPGGDNDYFQTAHMVDRHMGKVTTDMTIETAGQVSVVPASAIAITDEGAAAKIGRAPVVIVATPDPEALKHIDVSGKAVLVPQLTSKDPADARRSARAFDRALSQSKAAIEIVVGSRRGPQVARLLREEQASGSRVPQITVVDDRLKPWLENHEGAEQRMISIDLPGPDDQRVTLKNVVGVLPGSDPKLKETAVMVTAHYDHIGTTETGRAMSQSASPNSTDHIYNGANDDGSGTVSVIEIAKALSRLDPHPKRTIVFVAFFGEERGLIGSSYYGQHPIWPLSKTVADLNLEQIGRTDASDGRQVGTASVTGYDYSDVTKYLEQAGGQTGVRVYKNPQASDAYFLRSDNDALAEVGIPAHTLCVAFDYPDYHGLGDEWQKIDYINMAKVDRMVALALANMADSAKAPEWNASNNKTAAFRAARAQSLAP